MLPALLRTHRQTSLSPVLWWVPGPTRCLELSVIFHLRGLLSSTISVFSRLLFHSMTPLKFPKPFHTAFWNSGLTTKFWTLLSGNDLLFTQPSEVTAAVSFKTLATPGLGLGGGYPSCFIQPPSQHTNNGKSSSLNIMSLVFITLYSNLLQLLTDPPS